MFGYFPTHPRHAGGGPALRRRAHSLGDLEEGLARGHFAPLLAWLREHRPPARRALPAARAAHRATGVPPSAEPFLAYVEGVAAEVYGVAAAAAAPAAP
jgi:carboxypeptidase Taq